MYGQTVPSELRDKFAMSVRQPLGVCVDHHAVEFPDGDPVVEDHPGAGLRQHRRLQAGDADAAVGAQLRQGPRRGRRPAGRRQPRHRRRRRRRQRADRRDPPCASCRSPARPTSAASSTQAAAPSFKKVHLEMGGKNVIMIMDDANLELAVDGCLWGGFGTTRPALHRRQPRGRAREGLQAVRRAFVARAQALRVGDGLDADDADGARRSARRSSRR